MKKSLFLIIGVSLALLVSAGMQVQWILNSYKTLNQLADMNLSIALENTIQQLSNQKIQGGLENNLIITGRYQKDTLQHREYFVYEDSSFSPNVKTFTHKQEIWRFGADSGNPDMKAMVDKVISDLSREPVSLSSRIEAQSFKFLIQKNLKSAGVEFPVEYGIYDENQKLSIKSPGFDSTSKSSTEQRSLFKNNLFWKPATLHVQAPNRRQFILKQLSGSIFISALVLFFIGAGIYLIYKQSLKLQKTMQLKSDFLTNMSHEFKTPIATIDLCAQTMQLQNPENKGLEHYVGIVRNETARMEQHVNRMLEMARIEKGDLPLKLTSVDLNAFIPEILQQMDFGFKQVGFQCSFKPYEDSPMVMADVFHLENVCRNICENALNYRNKNVDSYLQIAIQKQAQNYIVQFADNGMGIPTDAMAHIFEPFYRVADGNLQSTRGTGLGLAYCKNILEQMGGGIAVKNNTPQGSIFEIRLPESNHV